jgi:lipoic acid synthetase
VTTFPTAVPAVEVLVSDFAGAPGSAETVAAARPDVFNHNVETVPRLYGRVRPEADYGRSLSVLARAREVSDGALPTKSGLMLGLGETRDEVEGVMRDLRDVGVSLLTLGQYLRPSADHLPVMRFVPPQEFVELARVATEVGFRFVASAPYVRSSYRASDLARSEGVGVPAHLSSAHLR